MLKTVKLNFNLGKKTMHFFLQKDTKCLIDTIANCKSYPEQLFTMEVINIINVNNIIFYQKTDMILLKNERRVSNKNKKYIYVFKKTLRSYKEYTKTKRTLKISSEPTEVFTRF